MKDEPVPQNVPQSAGLIVLVGMLVAVAPISIDTYTPSLPAIADALGVASGTIGYTLITFFFGLACGGVFWGPLSDRFGRRPILFTGLGIFILASMVCAFAASAATLIIARAVQGLAAAAMPATGLATTRDVWSGDRAARAISLVMLVIGLAPLLAPLIGGQLQAHFGWRSVFWFMTGFALVALAAVSLRLPETNDAARRGDVRVTAAFQAYGRVLADLRVWLYLLCGGLGFAALFAYVTGIPFVYIDLFHVDPRYFGFLIGINVIGTMAGTWLNSRLVTRYGSDRMLAAGMIVSAMGMAALFVFVTMHIGGLAAIVGTLFIGLAPVPLIGANTVAGLMNLYPQNAGSCSALFGMAQYGLGSLGGVLVSVLYTGSPLALAGVTLGCVMLALSARLGLYFASGKQAEK
jgi:DHA1 family bicyclomycin/chloramphenicol resistance-like MFS transporter